MSTFSFDRLSGGMVKYVKDGVEKLIPASNMDIIANSASVSMRRVTHLPNASPIEVLLTDTCTINGSAAPVTAILMAESLATNIFFSAGGYVVAKTAAYTAGAADDVITADSTSAAFTITLPTAVGLSGRRYTIKKIDSSANAVTVNGGGVNIDAAATYALSAQWKYVTVVSDNIKWLIIAQN